MKFWKVKVPLAGYMTVEIEADDYNEAIKNGINKANKNLNCEDVILDVVDEINAYEKLVEGNIVYASPYKATAECIEDDIY
jgi:hypothetical protein